MGKKIPLVVALALLLIFLDDISSALHAEVSVAEVVRARFGAGPDALGIITPKEGNPEGPMSFALGRSGEIYILDQVNSRIQVFRTGKRRRTIRIRGQTFADIDVTPDKKIVLLDNSVKKAVYTLDPEGRVLGSVPLVGEDRYARRRTPS